MSLEINNTGAYEREVDEVEQNWAAAYAKRAVEELEIKHDEDKALLDTEISDLGAAVDQRATKTELDDAVDLIEGELEHYATLEDLGDEEAARVAKDNALADGTGLENNSIYSRHIRDGNVTTGKIHDGDVTAAKLATGAVTAVKIAAGAVTEGKIDNGAVTQLKIGDGAVSSLGLADGAVTADKIALGAVSETKIGSGAVTEAKIGSGAVTSGKIGIGAVTRDHLSSSAALRVHTANGDMVLDYCNGGPIDYILSGTVISSIHNKPLRDLAAQEWITNSFIIDSVDPPDYFDEGFEWHEGLLYLQTDGLSVMKVFVLVGATSLGANEWRQIYPAFSEYSATPQRVGTWVDGKPVWRIALPYIDFESGVRHISLNSSTYNIYAILTSLFSSYVSYDYDADNCPVINPAIYCVNDNYYQFTKPDIRNGIINFCKGDENLYNELLIQGSWGGYIEFVCPEEYIITE